MGLAAFSPAQGMIASGLTSADYPLFAPSGAVGSPQYSWSSATTTGWYFAAGDGAQYSVAGVAGVGIRSASGFFQIYGTWGIGWSSADTTLTADTVLYRDAAATLALKNGTNAQTFRVYGNTTGPKYLSLAHDGTNGVIDTAASSGFLKLGGNATSIQCNTNLWPFTDNGQTLGNSGARWTACILAAGTSTGFFNSAGIISQSTTSQATTGTTKQTLASFSLPANALSATGKGLRIRATFTTAANANSKTMTIDWGGQASVATVTTTTSADTVTLIADVIKSGASTQSVDAMMFATAAQKPIHTAGTQTDTSAITIAFTATTGTASGDATFVSYLIEYLA